MYRRKSRLYALRVEEDEKSSFTPVHNRIPFATVHSPCDPVCRTAGTASGYSFHSESRVYLDGGPSRRIQSENLCRRPEEGGERERRGLSQEAGWQCHVSLQLCKTETADHFKRQKRLVLSPRKQAGHNFRNGKALLRRKRHRAQLSYRPGEPFRRFHYQAHL